MNQAMRSPAAVKDCPANEGIAVAPRILIYEHLTPKDRVRPPAYEHLTPNSAGSYDRFGESHFSASSMLTPRRRAYDSV